MEEACEEDQGPRRAVEPMMIMMVMIIMAYEQGTDTNVTEFQNPGQIQTRDLRQHIHGYRLTARQ
jgi:hypothetical protein